MGRLPIIGIFVDREQSADNSDLTTRRRDLYVCGAVCNAVCTYRFDRGKKGKKKGGGRKKEGSKMDSAHGHRETPIVEVAPNTS